MPRQCFGIHFTVLAPADRENEDDDPVFFYRVNQSITDIPQLDLVIA